MTSFLTPVPSRDPRLDFFRGLAMLIIFVSHVPNNPWALFIPARFGFSDAAEIFVFCSGAASAFAFGRLFQTRGWGIGTARVLQRAWQIYWVHICLFLALAASLAALDRSDWFGQGYVNSLNLEPFFADPMTGLTGLLSLGYVPNYFDILPMYFGILLMIPVVVAAHRVHPLLAAGLVLGMWLLAQIGGAGLPADPWTARTWFFNPFGWQLIFFTGFAFASGWLPAPAVRRAGIWLAVAVLVLSLPFAYYVILDAVPLARKGASLIAPLTDKSQFGALRYVHFLALAYLAWAWAGPRGIRLSTLAGMASQAARVITRVGQQALATFVVGSFLARMTLIVFNLWGKTPWIVTLVNFAGFGALILTACLVGWFRRERTGGGRVPVPARPERDQDRGRAVVSGRGHPATI